MKTFPMVRVCLAALSLAVFSCQQTQEAQPGVKVDVSSSEVQMSDTATFNKVMDAPTVPDSVPAP